MHQSILTFLRQNELICRVPYLKILDTKHVQENRREHQTRKEGELPVEARSILIAFI